MGLFGRYLRDAFDQRRRGGVVESGTAAWQPLDRVPDWAPGYLMDDEGCASPNAYEATFIRGDRVGSTLTIWAYVVYGAAWTFDYIVGYRCEYRVAHTEPLGQPWTYVQYAPGVVVIAGDLDQADSVARHAARNLLAWSGSADSPVSVADWFDWDGQPW